MSVFNIAILVFREGLECVLVVAAVLASLRTSSSGFRRPIQLGLLIGLVVTALTWWVAIKILNDLTNSIPALKVQAATGLIAVCVLVVVMNWFFHRVYWTGWISFHNRRKAALLRRADEPGRRRAVFWGFVALGFTSLYREGVEVVLFLQSYRLRLGNGPVYAGLAMGLLGTILISVVTFLLHRRLPYRKMLVVTGVMLGAVLIVMVGEQAQEMQFAQWLPTTTIAPLARVLPSWAGLWFSVFPTIETLAAQILAALAVAGSYVLARAQTNRGPQEASMA